MRTIEIDGSDWREATDFLSALKEVLGSPHWHGDSPAAFIDSMVWGGVNALEPPYEIKIKGTSHIPSDVKDYIDLIARALTEARKDQLARRGKTADVSIVSEL